MQMHMTTNMKVMCTDMNPIKCLKSSLPKEWNGVVTNSQA